MSIGLVKERLQNFHAIVQNNRGAFRTREVDFTEKLQYPTNSPCHWCEGETGTEADLCDICIHNPDSLIWTLKDLL
jgi:hypothetical protein